MLNIIFNARDYYKYGKVVHRSVDGTVIRKKLDLSLYLQSHKSEVKTTKTVINRFNQVEKSLNRSTHIGNGEIFTLFDTITYSADGKVYKKTKPINYTIKKETKKISDYNAIPQESHIIKTLSDGRSEYTFFFPKTTTIVKGGDVVTTNDIKTIIV